jgi:UDP:flavonoid glycosyltransferase YjiC (YdhE family)
LRILFATTPADGHFNPLTGIATHLKASGHDVRWYSGPTYRAKLDALGIPMLAYTRAREVTGDNIATLFPERAKLKGPKLIAFDMEQFFVSNVAAYFQDISEAKRNFAFDAFFCDAAFVAGKLVADKLGVPVYAVGVSPPMTISGSAPPPFFGLRPPRTPLGGLAHRAVRAMVKSTIKPGARRFNDILASEGLSPIDPSRWFEISYDMARFYFQSGTPTMDYPRPDPPPNLEYVGALLPPRAANTEPWAGLDRVRTHPGRVIVVSQGTVDNDDPTKLIAPALEALRDTSHLVVVTTGGKNTANLRDRFRSENVIIEDFADFNELFEHADLFVTNGGYGSVMLALSHGVPLLAAGKREAKNDVNARIGYRRLGLDLRTERPSSRRIAAGVASLLADESVRENVRAVQAELASYDPYAIIGDHLAGASLT